MPDATLEAPADKARTGPDCLPADHLERQLISTVRHRNLFVDAGAGTGKTGSLVDRVEALVFDDGIAMESIAAITFTEKAAMELQNRIRRRFEERLACSDSSDDEKPKATAALEQLDSAAVGTLHSFAQRILSEHLVAAELPPGIEVLDEIGSQLDFETRWGEFSDDLLDNPEARKSLLVLDVAGVKPNDLRELALEMAANWDLVEARLDLDPPQPKDFDPQPLINEFDRVLAMRPGCVKLGNTTLLPYFDKLAANRLRLAAALDDIEALALAADMGESEEEREKRRNKRRLAIRVSTASNGPGGKALLHVREELRALGQKCDDAVGEVTAAALHHVGGFLGRFVLEAAEQRRAGGKLEFHDLLVRARRLLRHPDRGLSARKALHERYQRLLLDEFQDTDPIQIELAMLIASDPDAGASGAAEPRTTGNADRSSNGREAGPDPGRLFVVGDPKQSIYRFRRADIRTYLQTRERFSDEDRVDLSVNFRSVPPVIDWVNTVFGKLIKSDEQHGQPDYEPLSAHRTDEAPSGPAVALLGVDPVGGDLNADGLLEIEAKRVAAVVAEALYGPEPWEVFDRESEEWRPAVEDDVCILLPTRRSFTALEQALTDEGVPYRAETAALVYGAREVRELLLTLEAVADPTNELATVAALRSFVYGCGDDDLAHWRLSAADGAKRGLSLGATIPEDMAGHPVAEGLTHLRSLHDDRLYIGPSELLDRLIRERGVLESAVAHRDPRAVWRRLRFVVDQARAWSDAGGTDLRAYLRWTRLQGAENARVSETVLPESDDRSVRIMTIHSAKGLEFPIAVLSGMTTRYRPAQQGPAVVFPRDGSEVLLKASAHVASEGYDEWKPIDKQMDAHERIRLLYVAATRARDHLVVSLVRNAKSSSNSRAGELARVALGSDDVSEAGGGFSPHQPGVAWQPAPPPLQDRPQADPAERVPQPDRTEWRAERERVLAKAKMPRVVSASSLDSQTTAGRASAVTTDPGVAKAPRDPDLPPWKKGRDGTALGRAVHAVLQDIDLAGGPAHGSAADKAAEAQATAEDIPQQTRLIADLVRKALRAPVAMAASQAEHWRELWVAAPLGGQLIEGYVDLLYRKPSGGLVVVDWKTLQAASPADLEGLKKKARERYRLQGAAYALAVEEAAGEDVHEVVFVFLSAAREEAQEVRLENLRDAMAEVAGRVAELAEASAAVEPEAELW